MNTVKIISSFLYFIFLKTELRRNVENYYVSFEILFFSAFLSPFPIFGRFLTDSETNTSVQHQCNEVKLSIHFPL